MPEAVSMNWTSGVEAGSNRSAHEAGKQGYRTGGTKSFFQHDVTATLIRSATAEVRGRELARPVVRQMPTKRPDKGAQ